MKPEGPGTVLKVPTAKPWLFCTLSPCLSLTIQFWGVDELPGLMQQVWGWTGTKTPTENVQGTELFPGPLPSVPVDRGGNCGGYNSSPRVCYLHPLVSRSSLQERPHITLANFLHCCCFFFLNGKHFLFPNAINFNQIIVEPKKVAYIAVMRIFFSFAFSQSFHSASWRIKVGSFQM